MTQAVFTVDVLWGILVLARYLFNEREMHFVVLFAILLVTVGGFIGASLVVMFYRRRYKNE